jgi:hypothetical protein
MTHRRNNNRKRPKILVLCQICGLRYVSSDRELHLASCREWNHFDGIQSQLGDESENKAPSVAAIRVLRVNGTALGEPGPDAVSLRSVYASPAMIRIFQENPSCDALLIVVPLECRMESPMEREERHSDNQRTVVNRTTLTLGPLDSDKQSDTDLTVSQLRNHNHKQLRQVEPRVSAEWFRNGTLEQQLNTATAVVGAALEDEKTTVTLEYPTLVPVYTPVEQLWQADPRCLRRTFFHPDALGQSSQNILSLFPGLTGITTTVEYQKLTACTAFRGHCEDVGFASVNYLYEGYQVWYLFQFDDQHRLVEEWLGYMKKRYCLQEKGWSDPQVRSLCLLFCAKQVMIPPSVLDRVPHTRVIQHPHTVMVIRGDCFHYGFSFGGANRAYSINMLCPALYARDARVLRRTMDQVQAHWSVYKAIPVEQRRALPGAFLQHIRKGILDSMLWDARDVVGSVLSLASRTQSESVLLSALVQDWTTGSEWRARMADLFSTK